MKQLRRHTDWCWLNACLGIVEGDNAPVEAYLASGGDPARQLTHSEVLLLNRSSAFDVGHTLVHLAIRFVFFCVSQIKDFIKSTSHLNLFIDFNEKIFWLRYYHKLKAPVLV